MPIEAGTMLEAHHGIALASIQMVSLCGHGPKQAEDWAQHGIGAYWAACNAQSQDGPQNFLM